MTKSAKPEKTRATSLKHTAKAPPRKPSGTGPRNRADKEVEMSVEYMYVHFENANGEPVDATVLANSTAEGPANKLIMMMTGSCEVTLDTSTTYTPQSISVDLGGTTQVRPKILVFTPAAK